MVDNIKEKVEVILNDVHNSFEDDLALYFSYNFDKDNFVFCSKEPIRCFDRKQSFFGKIFRKIKANLSSYNEKNDE